MVLNDLEKAIVCLVNAFHRQNIYQYERYQLLHGIKYSKEIPEEKRKLIREKYLKNCFEAAYELKTYYAENGILSNTIVLKMRPESPDIQELRTIKIHSDLDDTDYVYTHHVIEIFKENGKYKVLDILHSDKIIWLETYLDNVCEANHCERARLRYDMGYLAPCHAFAGNMQDLSDVMRYLDKTYKIGKPRFSLINISSEEEGMLLSDDMAMDFEAFGREFGADRKTVFRTYQRVYDKIMRVRFNMLHMLCLGHIMRDPIISLPLVEGMFDDKKICDLLEKV